MIKIGRPRKRGRPRENATSRWMTKKKQMFSKRIKQNYKIKICKYCKREYEGYAYTVTCGDKKCIKDSRYFHQMKKEKEILDREGIYLLYPKRLKEKYKQAILNI